MSNQTVPSVAVFLPTPSYCFPLRASRCHWCCWFLQVGQTLAPLEVLVSLHEGHSNLLMHRTPCWPCDEAETVSNEWCSFRYRPLKFNPGTCKCLNGTKKYVPVLTHTLNFQRVRKNSWQLALDYLYDPRQWLYFLYTGSKSSFNELCCFLLYPRRYNKTDNIDF